MTRLAVAVRLPAEIVAVLARLARPPRAGVTWSGPEQWLVKLRPLGHVDPGLVDHLVDALGDELAAAEPATCVLGPATHRLAGQWLGAPVAGLDDLVAVVLDATVGIVPITHPQHWRAEVVLARGRVPADLAGEPVCGSWVAASVVLVADRSAPGRPRLTDLAEFALGTS
jgi:hypothetical protein